jgi:hypothetical protein
VLLGRWGIAATAKSATPVSVLRCVLQTVLLTVFALSLSACHGWQTPVPKYWPPVNTRRARIELPPPGPAVFKPRARPDACTAIYLVSSQNRLHAFKPKTGKLELQGPLNCPGAAGTRPFSMAVARTGKAQVVFNDGKLYEVDISDASCSATKFTPNQAPGFRLFGMGYAPNKGDDGETLYVAEITFRAPSKGLARVNTETGELSYIGGFSINPGRSIELTPSGNGPLYGYFINELGVGGTLVEIDTDSAKIVDMTALRVGTNSAALAIAGWGGSFYIFTSIPGGTQVTRHDPKTMKTKVVTTIDETIVGAGVSTCAPRTRS